MGGRLQALPLSEITLQVAQLCPRELPRWWEIPPNFLSVLQAVGATAHVAPAAILTMSGSAPNLPPGGWTVLREAVQHDPQPQLPPPGPLRGDICSAHVSARGWHGSHVLRSCYQQGINHMQLRPNTIKELSRQTDHFRETITVNRQDPGEKLPRVSCH